MFMSMCVGVCSGLRTTFVSRPAQIFILKIEQSSTLSRVTLCDCKECDLA